MSFMIFWNKKRLFWAIKRRSSKSRKIDIFPKGFTHGFGSNMGMFGTFFFLVNIGQENLFYDILERKTPFWALKTRSSRSRKIEIFPKGLTHGFGPKIAIFSTSFLGIICQENVFWDTLERKNAFLGYKNQEVKKSKNWDFCKGVDWWVLLKICFFPLFYFFWTNIVQERVF